MKGNAMNRSLWFLMIIALALTIALVGCGKKEEPKPAAQAVQAPPPAPAPAIADVVLAKGFDAAWNAVNPTTTFKPSDRINAVVKTLDAVQGNKVAATWWYVKTNQLIKSDTIALIQNGANHTQFFIERAKGWPVGDYRLDVSLNGGVPLQATFSVR
jgi:hypothetical protein